MIEVYIVSAFSKNGTGGNIAGVVLQSPNLTAQEKTKAAYRLGYSETAFVSSSGQADFKIEYFTPAGEVPLCGHATIGTFAVMDRLQMLHKPAYTIETKSGFFKISIDERDLIFMEQNRPQFSDIITEADMADCFRFAEVNKSLPIQIVSTGLRDILYPVASVDVLSKMVPDLEAVSRISREKNCIGIHAFSLTGDKIVTAVCRNFAPLYGIDEESATGTSNCALACYLHRCGIRQKRYTFEQGYNLNSISRIYVEVEEAGGRDGGVTGVYAGGSGYLIDKISISI